MPGCTVCFDHCRIHHLVSWDDGETTDLVNLVPLCWKHHHAVHDLGWILTLHPDRRLRIDHPDGTHSLGPPPRPRPTPRPAGALTMPRDRTVPLRT